jgi:hypothetical protein
VRQTHDIAHARTFILLTTSMPTPPPPATITSRLSGSSAATVVVRFMRTAPRRADAANAGRDIVRCCSARAPAAGARSVTEWEAVTSMVFDEIVPEHTDQKNSSAATRHSHSDMVVGKLARGAISLTGNLLAPVKEQSSAETVPVPLTVVALEKLAGNEHGRLLPPGMAAVNDRQPELAGRLTPTCFMELSSGSDCVLSVQGSQHVPEGDVRPPCTASPLPSASACCNTVGFRSRHVCNGSQFASPPAPPRRASKYHRYAATRALWHLTACSLSPSSASAARPRNPDGGFSLRALGSAPIAGCIALEEAHRYSLHLAEDTRVSFHTFLPPADKAEPFALTDLAAEGTYVVWAMVRSACTVSIDSATRDFPLLTQTR